MKITIALIHEFQTCVKPGMSFEVRLILGAKTTDLAEVRMLGVVGVFVLVQRPFRGKGSMANHTFERSFTFNCES